MSEANAEDVKLSNGLASHLRNYDTTMTSQNGDVTSSRTNGDVMTHTEDHVEILDAEKGPGDPNRETWGGKVEFLLTCIAFAVGLGNVWRFPYLCYANGGGAFLVPYVLMLAFLGLPLFFLELSLGQYASVGPITIWRLCPLFKGIGYCAVVVSCLVSIYYNVIIGWTVYYFFASFTSELPWSHCNNTWNTDKCRENPSIGPSSNSSLATTTLFNNISETTTTTISTTTTLLNNVSTTISGVLNQSDVLSLDDVTSPAQEYWEREVQKISRGLWDVGHVRWHLCLCLLFAWIVVYLCIMKGIKTSGKAVYFTATFPYLVLLILFIRGITLPGSAEGIAFYLKPDLDKMRHARVWKDAAVQILYSLGAASGGLLAMSSYNKFHNNCYKDAIIVSCINCGTSVFAGFVIFSVLGFMAHTKGVPVDHVVVSGPGLAFIAYPEAISRMPGAPFWSLCFFFMLFTLGLGSQFPGIECISTAFCDEFPVLRRHKSLFTLAICVSMFLFALPCVTEGGVYVIELLDKYATAFPLLTIALLETIVVSWIYGFRRLKEDIKIMLGRPPSIFWVACWTVISPILVVCIIIFTAIEYEGIVYHGYKYPWWGEAIGWLFVLTAIGMIPVWAFIKIWKHVGGTCGNLRWSLCGPASLQHWRKLLQPSELWGPALQENRSQQARAMEPTVLFSKQGSEKQSIIPSGLASLHNPGDSYI